MRKSFLDQLLNDWQHDAVLEDQLGKLIGSTDVSADGPSMDGPSGVLEVRTYDPDDACIESVPALNLCRISIKAEPLQRRATVWDSHGKLRTLLGGFNSL